MKTYKFPSNASWIVFADEKSQWAEIGTNGEKTIPEPKDIVALLDDVKLLFEARFSTEQVNANRLFVLPTNDDPTTFAGHNIIFLNARGRFWSQFAFQFAHELCHFIIHKTVSGQLRWFEESLCELASLYFLYELAEKWKTTPPYPSWQSYFSSFASYADERRKKAYTLPDGVTFVNFFAANIEMLSLEINFYKRKINTLCANYLLPIFIKNPGLWQDVPKISEIPSALIFKDALICWKELSDNKDAIQEIIKLFEY